jgi:quercetin dioxygenase-like cupin family protein
MLLVKTFELGQLKGTIYDFDVAGDILPEHTHTEQDVHITIVCKGKIKSYGQGWENEASAGQIINFKVNQPHEIMAIEDNTRIINILKNFGGTPNDYNKG